MRDARHRARAIRERKAADRRTVQLELAEAATLAALPRAPSRLNPRANKEAALEGRGLVLRYQLPL